jgi:hypothetical protein
MPKERPKPARKRRTREHVIADLSVHHVEGPILRCGFTVERIVHDYGLDLSMTTYDAKGEVENEYVLFQLKATDHLKRTTDGTAIVLRVEKADLISWLDETYPVILIVFDAQAEVAYWLYVQAHFAGPKATMGRGTTVTIHIPAANVLDENAIRRFAAAKAAIHKQTKEVQHHVEKD